MINFGSSLSVRQFARLGSSLSLLGSARFMGDISIKDEVWRWIYR